MNSALLSQSLMGLVLLIAASFDLKTRKIPNAFNLSVLGLCLAFVFVAFGWEGTKWGLISAVLVFSFSLPMVMLGMLGGGDLKLMVAVSVLMHPIAFFWMVGYAMIWACILGVAKAITAKEGKSLLVNTAMIFSKTKPTQESLHKIPFAIALFLGWATQMFLTLLPRSGAL